MIEQRPFGRTGHMSTCTLFGAAALGRVTQAEADHTMELLLAAGVLGASSLSAAKDKTPGALARLELPAAS